MLRVRNWPPTTGTIVRFCQCCFVVGFCCSLANQASARGFFVTFFFFLSFGCSEPRTVAPKATLDVAAMPPLDDQVKHNCIHDEIQRQTNTVRRAAPISRVVKTHEQNLNAAASFARLLVRLHARLFSLFSSQIRVVMNRTLSSLSKRQSGARGWPLSVRCCSRVLTGTFSSLACCKVLGPATPKNITIHVVHTYETENAANAVNSPACLRAGAIVGKNSVCFCVRFVVRRVCLFDARRTHARTRARTHSHLPVRLSRRRCAHRRKEDLAQIVVEQGRVGARAFSACQLSCRWQLKLGGCMCICVCERASERL